MGQESSFELELFSPVESGQKLLVGLSTPGLGGLTAVNQVIETQNGTEIGQISPAELPAITPFEDGRPRHHTRLYDLPDTDFTVLLSELFIPPWAARSFASHLLEWANEAAIEDVCLLHGVPYPHGPEHHKAYYVATDRFRERRLADTDVQAMKGGFLDGVAGELVSRSLREQAPPVGVLVTPAHVPGPDVDGALCFLDALEEMYGLSIDRTELEDLSDTIQKQLAALADHMAALDESEDSQKDREFYADRMYM